LLSLITILISTSILTSSIAHAGDVGEVVDLFLLPETQTAELDDVFDITIEANCNNQDVTGISAFLDFDPNHVEVQSITPGATLDVPIQNVYDNAAGTIDYSAGTFTSPLPSGIFIVATVTFKKLSGMTSTSIDFHTELPRTTDADYGGASKLRNLFGTIVVTPNAPVDHTETVDEEPEDDDENVEEDNVSPDIPEATTFLTENLVISPLEATTEESVKISVQVTNTGGMQDSYQLNLLINGIIEQINAVTLDAGISETVIFLVSKDIAGDYTVEINGQTGQFTVLSDSVQTAIDSEISSSPSKTDSASEIPTTHSETNWILIGGIVWLVIVAGVIITFLVIMLTRLRE
jgi:hypothetical protein